MQSAGCIEYQCIVTLPVGKLMGQTTDIDRVLISTAVENRDINLATEGL